MCFFWVTVSTDIYQTIEAKVVTWLEMRSRWERNARLLQHSDEQGYTADISDRTITEKNHKHWFIYWFDLYLHLIAETNVFT